MEYEIDILEDCCVFCGVVNPDECMDCKNFAKFKKQLEDEQAHLGRS